jgi:hypothetical protein
VPGTLAATRIALRRLLGAESKVAVAAVAAREDVAATSTSSLTSGGGAPRDDGTEDGTEEDDDEAAAVRRAGEEAARDAVKRRRRAAAVMERSPLLAALVREAGGTLRRCAERALPSVARLPQPQPVGLDTVGCLSTPSAASLRVVFPEHAVPLPGSSLSFFARPTCDAGSLVATVYCEDSTSKRARARARRRRHLRGEDASHKVGDKFRLVVEASEGREALVVTVDEPLPGFLPVELRFPGARLWYRVTSPLAAATAASAARVRQSG